MVVTLTFKVDSLYNNFWKTELFAYLNIGLGLWSALQRTGVGDNMFFLFVTSGNLQRSKVSGRIVGRTLVKVFVLITKMVKGGISLFYATEYYYITSILQAPQYTEI